MEIPAQHTPEGVAPGSDGWPANELEQVLSAALGDPRAAPRVVEVLGRSRIWVPLPQGGTPESRDLDLPTLELDGLVYVPVFTSEQQFLRVANGMSFAVAPAREFARGLPPQVGIALNPGGAVGIPLPPPAVAELCRAGGGRGGVTGGRVRLWEPVVDEEPVEFLASAAGEFAITPVVLSARRALASIEGDPPVLFVGVELDGWQEEDRTAATTALARALGTVPVPWAVNLVLLDIAQDPVGDYLLQRVRPFYVRD
jgi:SseB protein C-terminal domain/SseB protein N-terminal domain